MSCGAGPSFEYLLWLCSSFRPPNGGTGVSDGHGDQRDADSTDGKSTDAVPTEHKRRKVIVPNGVLTGFAIPALVAPLVDHTYVTSSHGHGWLCHGRAVGGHQICSGEGNTAQADCLSQPNSEAGVSYGKAGVCHQMANRILFPSGQTVSGARGYLLSIFFYGVYGIDLATLRHYSPVGFPWPELSFCQNNHAHT